MPLTSALPPPPPPPPYRRPRCWRPCCSSPHLFPPSAPPSLLCRRSRCWRPCRHWRSWPSTTLRGRTERAAAAAGTCPPSWPPCRQIPLCPRPSLTRGTRWGGGRQDGRESGGTTPGEGDKGCGEGRGGSGSSMSLCEGEALCWLIRPAAASCLPFSEIPLTQPSTASVVQPQNLLCLLSPLSPNALPDTHATRLPVSLGPLLTFWSPPSTASSPHLPYPHIAPPLPLLCSSSPPPHVYLPATFTRAGHFPQG